MATFVYNQFKHRLLTGEINLESDTIKCALVTSAYTTSADRDSHTAWDDITNEVSGTGYVAGGQVVTLHLKVEWWYAVVEMDELVWPDSTIANMRGAIFYKAAADPSQSWLICCVDTVTDKSTVNSDFYFHMWPLLKLN